MGDVLCGGGAAGDIYCFGVFDIYPAGEEEEMSGQNLPPDLSLLRDASDRSLEAYRKNNDRGRAERLEEVADRKRLAYMTKYVEWVGADPVEKAKMEGLITAIEEHWGWGREGQEGRVA